MHSIFKVTTTATEVTAALLTEDELRLAIGLASDDVSADGVLSVLEKQIAASIARECGIYSDGQNLPSVMLEICSETFHIEQRVGSIRLSRPRVKDITSVSVAGVALTALQYEVIPSRGVLLRLSGDQVVDWPCGKVVVEYSAGFEVVQPDLKLAASLLIAAQYRDISRDPNLKKESVPGVGDREYVGSSAGNPIYSPAIQQLLVHYKLPAGVGS